MFALTAFWEWYALKFILINKLCGRFETKCTVFPYLIQHHITKTYGRAEVQTILKLTSVLHETEWPDWYPSCFYYRKIPLFPAPGQKAELDNQFGLTGEKKWHCSWTLPMLRIQNLSSTLKPVAMLTKTSHYVIHCIFHKITKWMTKCCEFVYSQPVSKQDLFTYCSCVSYVPTC
jgi:hypothetical protein